MSNVRQMYTQEQLVEINEKLEYNALEKHFKTGKYILAYIDENEKGTTYVGEKTSISDLAFLSHVLNSRVARIFE